MAGQKDGKATIVIKKEEVVEGGHHGGAWKVAYADFVTAMMAFFLLMWLLNATTKEQKSGIADYFSPHNETSRGPSGFGGPFGGRTPNSAGALASDRGAVRVTNGEDLPYVMSEDEEMGTKKTETPLQARDGTGSDKPGQGPGAASRADQPPPIPSTDPQAADRPYPPTQTRPDTKPPTDADIQKTLERQERAAFERTAQQIRDAVAADPALADLARQLMIDITPEGLRVQLIDAEKQPMFSTGSATLNERARAVLTKIAPMLMKLPEAISISGHTDATPYKGTDRTNWDLSADRANATRRLLVEAGLQETRIRSVSGMADRDPLLTDDRLAAGNRRIAIVVLRDKPPVAK